MLAPLTKTLINVAADGIDAILTNLENQIRAGHIEAALNTLAKLRSALNALKSYLS